ncbi:MAG TPA: SpoIID/LytB domain-containing protein [Candidatus Eremiobacteraceae bacterium]|nr:SpoIID/LytB domain-containing protein [Candidatus Eremiobacteraceae bacterium]
MLAVLAAFFMSCGVAQAQTAVRISLLRHQLQVVVASAGGLVVRPYVPGAAPILSPEVTTVVDVRPQPDGLLIAGSIQSHDRLLITPLTDLALTVDGQPYRGSIVVDRDSDASLSVVNGVELEQYLYSVVGSEVSASTPPAALQAQAIVARTYAVGHLGAHDDLGFDLHAGDRDQAYNGMQAESQPVVDAVDATRNVVMIYRNHLAQAYYSACDGGYTSDGRALGDPQPYLQAVRDPYCPLSPYMHWNATIPLAQFVATLNARGLLAPPLLTREMRDIRAGAVDASGRLETVILVTTRGTYSLEGTQFRALVGNSVMKSTKIATLALDGALIRASGAGYGHGVGMCQLGARGMADAGLGVYAIINFYYPGVLLTQLASERPTELLSQARP